MKSYEVLVREGDTALFRNHTAFCVGTGRMDLALRKDYQEQLAMTQREVGFQCIRGHGLFSDGMGIYQPYTDADGVSHDAYVFTYLDEVVDSYLAQGLKPFLELGFMPSKMASGTQTLFYWRANVTPPKTDEAWVNMVKATLAHLAERYGADEVSTWHCEVWNEPNLSNFWENADEAKYLHLYAITSRAVKEVLPNMPVGGPAICGGPTSLDWVRHFLDWCRDERLPLDFVTRHAYMGNTPEHKGRYMYHEMRAVDELVDEMRRTREIIDSYPEYRGMDMHITEFNTSYNPFCPIHDTNLNAAYMAGVLSRLGDVAASYSYWTFGDVFEELGVPGRPFHGGFGMVAYGQIAKPTLWAFAFFARLKGEAVYRDERLVLTRLPDGSYEGVAWNLCREEREDMTLTLTVPAEGELTLCQSLVDEATCNPLKCWHDMGEPQSLSAEQLRFLRKAGEPLCSTQRVAARDGKASARLTLGANGVMHFTLKPRCEETEYGYEYEWYQTHV